MFGNTRKVISPIINRFKQMIGSWYFVGVCVTLSYLLFFYPVLNPNTVIFSGEDSIKLHYPAKLYLEEKVREGVYPFWTERMFLGFPLYEDIERGFMNVVNLALIYTFGAFNSYKILHFLCYFVGSLSFYLLLRKHNFSFLSFIVGNFIYFFNFLLIFHQQHFNFILVAYLLPAHLYLIDSFFSRGRYKYLAMNLLLVSFCFYLGYLQYVFLMLLAGIAYSLVYFWNTSGIRKIWKHYLHFFAVLLILFIPAIAATSDLFLASSRHDEHNPSEGSFFPGMIVTLVHPFPFNREANYQGRVISEDFNIEETYIYLGITTVLFSLAAFLSLKDTRLRLFIILLVLFFVITAFTKYLPFSIIQFFPFSIFRYWARSVLYLNLASAFLVAYMVSNYRSLVLVKSNLFIALGFLLILSLIQINHRSVLALKNLVKFLIYNNSEYHSFNTLWLILLFSAIAVIVVYFLKGNNFALFPYLVTTLVVLDLSLFGSEVLKYNGFADKQELYRVEKCKRYPKDLPVFENSRVLDTTGCVEGDNALTYKQWGLLGISTFTPDSHRNYIKSAGLSKRSVLDSDTGLDYKSDSFKKSVSELGFDYIVYDGGDVQDISAYRAEADSNMRILIKKEGHFKAEVDSSRANTFQTFIKTHRDWVVYVNGNKVEKQVGSNDFIFVPLEEGKHVVEVKFEPRLFLSSVIFTSVAIFLYVLGQVLYRFRVIQFVFRRPIKDIGSPNVV